MRPIDADTLERHCKAVIEQSWNHASVPASWAQAFATFLDMLETAPTIAADDYFDAVDRIKPCPNCRYTLMGTLDTGKDNNVPTNWHPVSEPPKPNEDGSVNCVLVTNGFFIHMAYFANGKWIFCESGQMKEEMFYEVTHWMPLPEGSKEEK